MSTSTTLFDLKEGDFFTVGASDLQMVWWRTDKAMTFVPAQRALDYFKGKVLAAIPIELEKAKTMSVEKGDVSIKATV